MQTESRATTLYEKIIEIVGKPKWYDTIDNGHTRLKWKNEFPLDPAIKVREILLTYPEWMIIHYNPAYKQSEGKISGMHGVIKFCVDPKLISYPYREVLKERA